MRRLALLAIFATACGSAVASASTLALAFHPGDVYRFSFESTRHVAILPSAPETVHETAHLVYTVHSVDSGGNADISLETSEFVITATGGPVTPPTGTSFNGTSDLKVGSDGHILSATLVGSALSGGTWWAVLPRGAVKPGDTWSNDYDVSYTYQGSSLTTHFKTNSKYLRDETFEGVNAGVVESKIATTAVAPTSDPTSTTTATAASTITTWIDRRAGRVLKSHVTSTGKATYGDPSGSTPPTIVTDDEIADLLPG